MPHDKHQKSKLKPYVRLTESKDNSTMQYTRNKLGLIQEWIPVGLTLSNKTPLKNRGMKSCHYDSR